MAILSPSILSADFANLGRISIILRKTVPTGFMWT